MLYLRIPGISTGKGEYLNQGGSLIQVESTGRRGYSIRLRGQEGYDEIAIAVKAIDRVTQVSEA